MSKTRICQRFEDETIKRIRRLSQLHKISEADMWRLVVARGLDSEEKVALKMQVEALCLVRRLVGSTDPELYKAAKRDAISILESIEYGAVLEFENDGEVVDSGKDKSRKTG